MNTVESGHIGRTGPRMAIIALALLLALVFPGAVLAQEDMGAPDLGGAVSDGAATTSGAVVASDKPDYAPGERVTLSGGGWQPGESIDVFVNDSGTYTWQRNVTVIADETGAFTDEFDLPNWFVETYSVVATGERSGVASSSFTDGNVTFPRALTAGNGNPASYTVAWQIYNDSACTVQKNSSGSVTFYIDGSRLGNLPPVGNQDYVKPTSVTPSAGHTFRGWTAGQTHPAPTSVNAVCLKGESGGGTQPYSYAHFDTAAAVNTAPSLTDPSVSPGAPRTNDSISVSATGSDADAGDSATLTYRWERKAASAATFSPIAGATTSTLNLATAGHGDRGDQLRAVVTATDTRNALTSKTSSAVTVADTAPVVTSVAISGSPRTNDEIAAPAVVASDADGDAITPSYQWQKRVAGDWQDLAGRTGSTLDLGPAGNGDKDDELRVVVTATAAGATDARASNALTVADTAPVVSSVTLSGSPRTNDAIQAPAVVASDADGDPVTRTFQWQKRAGSNPFAAIPGATGDTLDLAQPGNGDKGDHVRVIVTATAAGASDSDESNALTVADTPSTISASLSGSPKTADGVSPVASGVDVDGDEVVLSYQWQKQAAGAEGFADLAGRTGRELDLAGDGNGDKGDRLRVVVSAPTAESVTTGDVLVGDTAPVVSSVSIAGPRRTADVIEAPSVSDADADGDVISRGYRWQKLVGGEWADLDGETGSTLDLAQPGNGDKGEQLRVVVTATADGASDTGASNALTVADTAPVVSAVTLTGSPQTTGTAGPAEIVSADADGDDVTYTYSWQKRTGTGDFETVEGADEATLDLGPAGRGDRDDQVRLVVTGHAAGSSSSPAQSNAITIADTPPVISSVSIAGPKRTDDAIAAPAVSDADADGDAITRSHQWQKEVSAGVWEDLDGETGPTLDLSQPGNGDKGERLRVVVTSTAGGASDSEASNALTVADTAPTLSMNRTASGAQYSDAIQAVTLTGNDADGETVTFTAGGLPNGVTLSGDTISGPALDVPGVYPASIRSSAGGAQSAAQTLPVTVTQEDARVTYTGATHASSSASTANVTLSATVQDISALAGNPDIEAGDVRTARVDFKANGGTVCSNVPVGLVSSADSRVGTATCTWAAPIPSAGYDTPTISTVVHGRYTRNDSADNAVVNVSKPMTSFITGGGYLVNSSSSGQYAGERGRRTNFGFNVKYNKAGTSLQGNINAIVRNGTGVYQVKGNSMTSLSARPATTGGTATFNGKASIQDITNPLAPQPVDGNATLQVTMTDRGEPGSADLVGITVFNKTGGIWFVSAWSGTQTLEQLLAGGNLAVR